MKDKKALSLFCVCFLFVTLVFCCANSFGATVYVGEEEDFTTIQAGIDGAAAEDVVVVRDGTYTGTGNVDLDFGGKAITLISENGPKYCIIDGQWTHRAFYFHSGETATSVVSGFTITKGKEENGGAVLCDSSSSPTITNCIIKNCIADGGNGGGIRCYNSSSPTISNCIFTGNNASSGGGISCSGSSAPIIVNCTITGNFAFQGGAISCSISSSPTVTNCILWNNTPTEIYKADEESIPVVTYSDVQDEYAGEGNLNTDPLFVNPNAADFHLEVDSPCVDAGSNEATGLPAEDQDGNPRILPLVDGVVDMGVYEANIRRILATAGEHGSISPSGDIPVLDGADLTFKIIADKNYHIGDVLVDGESVGARKSYTFADIRADHEIAADFSINNVTITATAGEHGTISPSGAVAVDYGASQTFTITPDAGYEVADVLVDGESIGGRKSYTFTNVTANHTLEARFTPPACKITVKSDIGGTIKPSGVVEVMKGGNQVFHIKPEKGYKTDNVIVDGKSLGELKKYTFRKVLADHTIEALFSRVTHKITATAQNGGIIDPYGTILVEDGASLRFSISADEGFKIRDVRVDGYSIGQIDSYTFAEVVEDHTIHVLFGKYTISGQIKSGNAPFAGVLVKLNGPASGTAVTDAKGNYSFTALVNGDYTITPTMAQHRFQPSSKKVKIKGADVAGIDFKGSPVAPLSDFSGKPLSGKAPLTVKFTDKSSGAIQSYSWDFGDGEKSTSRNATHTYEKAGKYTVSHTVEGKYESNTKQKADYVEVTE